MNDPVPAGEGSPRGRDFRRELGLFDSTMIVIGSMIGSGIFIVSADIGRTVGGGGYLLLVWGITGVITLLATLCYGELAGMMPQAGGQYVYLREAYNPLVGFLYGWTLFLVIQTGTIAAVAVAFAKFTGVLLPWFSEKNVLLTIGSFQLSAAQLLAILCISLLTYVNLLGVRTGKVVQNAFTATKTLALLLLIVLGVWVGCRLGVIDVNVKTFWEATRTSAAEGAALTREPLSGWMLLSALGTAMVGSLFACDAWNNVTFTAGEVKRPKRDIALSMIIGASAVVVLYLLANLAYFLLLPVTGEPAGATVEARGIQFAASDRVGTAAAAVIFGGPAEGIMAVLIAVSTFGCANGLVLAGPRVYYAMAQDGLFFRQAGTLSAKSVPGAALLLQGLWASLLCLSGTYGDLLDYVIFAVLIFYVLTVIGIFVLRKKRPEADRPYRTFGYPVVPILYVLAASALMFDLLLFKPTYTWPGLVIVVLGIPVYFLWRNKQGPNRK